MPLTTAPAHLGGDFIGRRPPQRLSHLLARLLRRNPGGHGAAVGADLWFLSKFARLAQWIGVTGTTSWCGCGVLCFASAFIGWNGVSALLGTLQFLTVT